MITIVGTGTDVPKNRVPTSLIAELIGTPIERLLRRKRETTEPETWLIEKTGIRERRTHIAPEELTWRIAHDYSIEVESAERAIRKALKNARAHMPRFSTRHLSAVYVLSSTQQPNSVYNKKYATALHRLLRLRPHQIVHEYIAGCAGALEALSQVYKTLEAGESAVIVASSFASQYAQHYEHYNRVGAWLSLALFGDGAGAMVVTNTDEQYPGCLRIDTVSKLQFSDVQLVDITMQNVDGIILPVYTLNGSVIKTHYSQMMNAVLANLGKRSTAGMSMPSSIKKGYFIGHAANLRLIVNWAEAAMIETAGVPALVDQYGNLGAATIMVTLADFLPSEHIAAGTAVTLVAVGAPNVGVGIATTVL